MTVKIKASRMIKMQVFNADQRKLIAGFFSNMSVLWFGAALIAPANQVVAIRSFIQGLIAFTIAILIMSIKGVYEK